MTPGRMKVLREIANSPGMQDIPWVGSWLTEALDALEAATARAERAEAQLERLGGSPSAYMELAERAEKAEAALEWWRDSKMKPRLEALQVRAEKAEAAVAGLRARVASLDKVFKAHGGEDEPSGEPEGRHICSHSACLHGQDGSPL